jgi:hypothetical protein
VHRNEPSPIPADALNVLLRLINLVDRPIAEFETFAIKKNGTMEQKSLRRAAGNKQRSGNERWPKVPASPNCVTAIFEDSSACEANSNSSVSPLSTITTHLKTQVRRVPQNLQRVPESPRNLRANMLSVVHTRNKPASMSANFGLFLAAASTSGTGGSNPSRSAKQSSKLRISS